MNETSLQRLHISSHIDLIQRNMEKLRSERCIILLDRFWWSTYVYGLAGGLDSNIVQTILEPELVYWKNINIKKIFLLDRGNRERDYDEEKDKIIVGLYRELSSKDAKILIIRHDGSKEEALSKIYNIIVGA